MLARHMQKLIKIHKKEENQQSNTTLTSAMLKKSIPNLIPDKVFERKVKTDEVKEKLEKELNTKNGKIKNLENGLENMNNEIKLFFFDICEKIELDPVMIFYALKKKTFLFRISINTLKRRWFRRR